MEIWIVCSIESGSSDTINKCCSRFNELFPTHFIDENYVLYYIHRSSGIIQM